MKSKFGTFLILLGCLMVAAALAQFAYNQKEQRMADAAAQEAIPMVVDVIAQRMGEQTEAAAYPEEMETTDPTVPPQKTMPVVRINGHDYIGFVSIPALELELPVMAEWNYQKLRVAPCRYTGDVYSDDLVLLAHNYPNHFGRLKNLRTGDSVTFTDMDGEITRFEIVALDILDPDAVEEMVSGEFDLTLFTCTYGGENRVTVRCDRVE